MSGTHILVKLSIALNNDSSLEKELVTISAAKGFNDN